MEFVYDFIIKFVVNMLEDQTLSIICTLLLVTFAITLIFKTSATTNFAQGIIASFGCYMAAYYLYFNANVNPWISLLIGLPVGILLGLFVDVVLFRNGRNVNLVGKQIITMGLVSLLGNIIPTIINQNNNYITIGIPQLIKGELSLFTIAGNDIKVYYSTLVYIAITVILLVTLFILLRFSKWGLGVRTTASNEYVAQMMGVNTYVITAISWSVAGCMGVLAAIMINGYVGNSFDTSQIFFMTEHQINGFLAGILGGFGTFIGPLVGAIIIPTLEMLFGTFKSYYNNAFLTLIGDNSKVIVYIVVMFLIYLKPNGLIGKKIVKKV